jgi:hypothetical protein
MEEFIKAFRRNPDGSWTCTAPATRKGPFGLIEVNPGDTFAQGILYKGVDVAAWLDEQSGKERRATSG